MLMDVREVGWEDVDWIHLAQDMDWWQALVNMVMNSWVLPVAYLFCNTRDNDNVQFASGHLHNEL
jgi:hypothetical protein